MSTVVVTDVSGLQTSPAWTKKVNTEQKTTITPFEKVLEKTQKIEVNEQAQKSSSEEAAKIKDGKVELKAIFQRAAKKYDISYDFLVAVAKAESNFNTDSVSSAGAQGMMQLMPETAKDLGVDDPFDPEESIMAAARLLKAHLEKFDGDYTLAAAAYNAGSGAVQKYDGVPPYTETQNYVKKIAKYMEDGVTVPDKMIAVENTAKYGEAKKAEDSFDKGKTATDDDIEQITVAVGTGDNTVTMTYGAYLKYLELGDIGVG